MSTITMQELELEHAELLPRRETLTVKHGFNFNQFNASYNGNDNGNGGNVTQGGGIGNTAVGGGNLSGNLNGNASGNNVQFF